MNLNPLIFKSALVCPDQDKWFAQKDLMKTEIKTE